MQARSLMLLNQPQVITALGNLSLHLIETEEDDVCASFYTLAFSHQPQATVTHSVKEWKGL